MKINYKEVTVVTTCPFCGHANEVEVNEMDYLDWDDGMLAQNAFPYLSATEREQIISGICPDCQKSIFGDDEEDEDYDPDWDYNEDMGYDPYLGAYSDDC